MDDAKGASVATGTITNDDAVPTIGVGNGSAFVEGDDGKQNMVFTLTLSSASSQAVTVKYTTNDGAAKGLPVGGTVDATHDFNAIVAKSITIPAGDTNATFTVEVLGDTRFEGNETFTVTLSDVTNAVLDGKAGTGTIVNNDVAPTITITNASGAEGTGVNGKATFTVALSGVTELPVTVSYATADGTAADATLNALAASDYVAQTGTLRFEPGDVTSQQIVIDLIADATDEKDETFFVNLSGPTGATIADAQGIGTIQNDESIFTIEPAAGQSLALTEESAPDTNNTLHLVVKRSSGIGAASVRITTADGSGVTGAKSSGPRVDFVAVNQLVSFADGETEKAVDVTINKDVVYENAETFRAVLSAPTNGVLGALADIDRTITITDNEAAPTLSILQPPAPIVEGNDTSPSLVFTVLLSGVNEREAVEVKYGTTDGTAISTGAKSDFVAPVAASKLTFAVGSVSQTLSIAVNGDVRDELDESFTVTISDPTAAAITAGKDTATGTITDNDTATLSVDDLTITENGNGLPGRAFTVKLSLESQQEVKVDIRSIVGGTATAGADYTAFGPSTITFAPGETEKTFDVTVNDDVLDEAQETFEALLENPINATISDKQAVATITDNDAAPALSINDFVIVEGDSGTSDMIFTVNLTQASGQEVKVNFTTQDGTAKATGPLADYIATSGTLIFAPGETSKTITVPIIGDTFQEPEQVFTVNLSASANASLADGVGTGTIQNGTDSTLVLTVADVAVVEGDAFVGPNATFKVQLSDKATSNVTFQVATRNGTAVKGIDYDEIVQRTVTILAGKDSVDVLVGVNGDTSFEATESFFLELTNFSAGVAPTGLDASGRLQVRGTIYNDDFQFLNGGRTAQWIDVDGDLVTLSITRGTLSLASGDDLDLVDVGSVGGRQLRLLDFSNDGNEFFGTSISVIATPQPGFTGLTDGRVDVGEIRAAFSLPGELQFVGIDLGVVTIDGDLREITAGDSFSTPAISKLNVFSLGVRAPEPRPADQTPEDRQSDILGPIGTVHVTSTLEGVLHVIGQEFGNIGTLKIDGALKGGAADNSGLVFVTGRISNVLVKDIIGGSGDSSGRILGDANNGGSIGTVKVTGSITGGLGSNSGRIEATRIGNVTVRDLIGGAGSQSGVVNSNGSIGTVTLTGGILGGAGVNSANIVAGTDMGAVKIGGDVVGGSAAQAGLIFAGGKIASVAISGTLIGGSASEAGLVNANGAGIGFVKIGKNAAGDSIIGGTGAGAGQVSTSGKIGSVTLQGALRGGGGVDAGQISAPSGIGSLALGRDMLGDSLVGGAGARSGQVLTSGKLGSMTLLGAIQGGAGADAGEVIASAGVGSISIGRNLAGDSIGGGAGAGSGALSVNGNVGSMTLLGSLHGGLGNGAGSISVNGTLAKLDLRGSIIGGDSQAGVPGTPATSLSRSGYLAASVLGNAVIGGNLEAGTDEGIGIADCGAIRTGVIASLTIKGNVIGNEDNPAIISAAGLSKDLAIGKLTIGGNVAFAEILAGYDLVGTPGGDFRGNQLSADAQIGTVQVNGNVQALNIVAGAQTGSDDSFGTNDDLPNDDSGVKNVAGVISRIASVIIKGTTIATPDLFYGIVAQHIVSVKLGAAQTPLAGLTTGPGNDTAPGNSDQIGVRFNAVELALL